jgi:peroxisomal 2,4-dienoyl-CoA reductase
LTFIIIFTYDPYSIFFHSFPFYQAAVDSITRSLALEWGTDYNIRVNGIAPGPIEDTAGTSKLGPEEMMSSRQHMPLFKLGEKWDIAMAALYLASDAGQ